ncbi:MAG: type 2 isopentenyl-diphosphate Delta-isomerase [Bacillota bacterium]|nr:type 2 isopentenyl-diphosphate Delta-isomerase [Bacillota bacterium]
MADSEEVLRQRRKVEHLEAARALGDTGARPGFDDVQLLPDCVPEVDWEEVELGTTLCGVALASPLIINAMTGGAPESGEINRRLAEAARRHGLAMAVGSEKAALRDRAVADTYAVARRANPGGVLIANVGMGTRAAEARAAVELIDAQLLQVHFNAGQELFMAEGERRFRGALEAFHEVCAGAGVPVIAKEVGQGIAAPEAERLVALGAAGVDVGGRGGTNFLAVESWRRGMKLPAGWESWGIPTAAALCEVVDAVGDRADVVASGGIRSGLEVAKAMALGAAAVGVAAPFVRLLATPDGDAAVDAYIEEIHWSLRAALVLTGSRNWAELRRRPVVITGALREWLSARGRETFLGRCAGR